MLVRDAPIEAPEDSVQLDLYAVNVFGVASDLAETCQSLLRSVVHSAVSGDSSSACEPNGDASAAFVASAKVLASTIPAAARADFVDGSHCVRLLVDSALAVRAKVPKSASLSLVLKETFRGLSLLGGALQHHAADAALDEFVQTIDRASELFDEAQLRRITREAVHAWSADSRARRCEEWLRERSSWSTSAALVAHAWSSGVESEIERQKVTDAVSIYLAESADVSLLLGQMHGRCGAIDDARYWLGEGQNRFPDDKSLELELTRWS